MEKDRIAKKVYVGECGSRISVGKRRKRVIDAMKKRGLDFSQARRLVHDGSIRLGKRRASPGDEPLNFDDMLQLLVTTAV